jgi:hypothetical protein
VLKNRSVKAKKLAQIELFAGRVRTKMACGCVWRSSCINRNQLQILDLCRHANQKAFFATAAAATAAEAGIIDCIGRSGRAGWISKWLASQFHIPLAAQKSLVPLSVDGFF